VSKEELLRRVSVKDTNELKDTNGQKRILLNEEFLKEIL
tara:strand:- start:34 stop:150 length:117 start_codon:yes stop_codon:yes gene_type:complete